MKRNQVEIRNAILKVLEENKRMSIFDISKKARTNWHTAKNYCDNLAIFKIVNKIDEKYQITKYGLECLREYF